MTKHELLALVHDFEAARVSRERWTHDAHVAVAAWYLLHCSLGEALDRMRRGIPRLNAANGVPQTPTGGYHETLTRFYMWLVGEALATAPRDASVEAKVARAIDACVDRTLPLRYYSRDRLMSWDARTSWVPPDLTPVALPPELYMSSDEEDPSVASRRSG